MQRSEVTNCLRPKEFLPSHIDISKMDQSPPQNSLKSDSDHETGKEDSVNPFTIPEVVAHLMTFVKREDITPCRLTCSSWNSLGAREILRRFTFKFTEDNLYCIDSFQSLMGSTLQTPIRLKATLTQFGFCRHFQQLTNIIFMYGDRISHFTIELEEKERNLEFEKLRIKLMQIEAAIRNETANFQTLTALAIYLSQESIAVLKVLNHRHSNKEGVVPYYHRMQTALNTILLELICLMPNLNSLNLTSHEGVFCKYFSQVLPIHCKAVANLRHLTIVSPSLRWDSICRVMKRSKAILQLDTLTIETVSPFIRRIELSSSSGKSRIILTVPLHLRLDADSHRTTSSCYYDFKRVHILETAIAKYEKTHGQPQKNGVPHFINCIGLLGTFAKTLHNLEKIVYGGQ